MQSHTYTSLVTNDFTTILQVKSLYRLVKFDSPNITHDSYVGSWDLRRLYTYAWRRQLDAEKRKQLPRDQGFEKNMIWLIETIDRR